METLGNDIEKLVLENLDVLDFQIYSIFFSMNAEYTPVTYSELVLLPILEEWEIGLGLSIRKDYVESVDRVLAAIRIASLHSMHARALLYDGHKALGVAYAMESHYRLAMLEEAVDAVIRAAPYSRGGKKGRANKYGRLWARALQILRDAKDGFDSKAEAAQYIVDELNATSDELDGQSIESADQAGTVLEWLTKQLGRDDHDRLFPKSARAREAQMRRRSSSIVTFHPRAFVLDDTGFYLRERAIRIRSDLREAYSPS